jgi:hypothetical protein
MTTKKCSVIHKESYWGSNTLRKESISYIGPGNSGLACEQENGASNEQNVQRVDFGPLYGLILLAKASSMHQKQGETQVDSIVMETTDADKSADDG